MSSEANEHRQTEALTSIARSFVRIATAAERIALVMEKREKSGR